MCIAEQTDAHFEWHLKNTDISGATLHSLRRAGFTFLAERGVGMHVLLALEGRWDMATHNVLLICVLLCLNRVMG